MNNLTHNFLQWLIENYGVRLSMSKEDAELFEQQYPDLAEQLEKENETINNCEKRFTNESR